MKSKYLGDDKIDSKIFRKQMLMLNKEYIVK
jgi:hypothetical protein